MSNCLKVRPSVLELLYASIRKTRGEVRLVEIFFNYSYQQKKKLGAVRVWAYVLRLVINCYKKLALSNFVLSDFIHALKISHHSWK
jgi:hypothetical protein